jgi:acyl carrier protein
MTSREIEAEVLRAFQQIMPRGIKASRVVLNADFKSDLGVESIGLFSVIALIEQKLNIDLFGRTKELAEARTIGDVVKIAASVGPTSTDRGTR